MEKETFEEILAKKAKDNNVIDLNAYAIGIIDGYKCQQENMYSDKDVKEAFRNGQESMYYSEMYGMDSELTEQEWFEKFKKK